jgi:hypothetical protein
MIKFEETNLFLVIASGCFVLTCIINNFPYNAVFLVLGIALLFLDVIKSNFK